MPNFENGKSAIAITGLAESALANTKGNSAEAAVMLIDAALAIAPTRFAGGVDQMAGYLAEYLLQQASHVVGGAGHA